MSVKAQRSKAPAPRRTQQARREATIGKLLDAAADVLIENGYASATVQKICARAGVSQGGLFRHFPTLEALMVAVGEHVGRQLLEAYRSDFERLRDREEPIALAIALVRKHCRSRPNQAWYELSVAARTNAVLRKALVPMTIRYYESIEQLARETLPDLAATLGPAFPVVVDTIVSIFDGEVVHRFVLENPPLEDARLEFLGMLLRQILPVFEAARASRESAAAPKLEKP